MNKKFDMLYETYVTRYTRGGFLTGDLVRFKKGFENTDEFKSLNPDIQQKLKDYADSDINVRVSGIENHYPSHQPGNTDNMNGKVVVTVSQETAPGRYDGFVTAPPELFDHIDVYPNRMPVPNSLVRPNGTEMNFDSEPLEGGYEDDENAYIGTDPLKSQIGTGTELKEPEMGDAKELHNVNQSIDQFGANNNWDQQSPGGGNMPDTSIYIKGNGPIPGPGNNTMTGNLNTTAVG